MEHGIYTIKNLITNQLYIGSAVNLDKRLYDHRNDLQRKVHHNKILQNSFNKYGESNFRFQAEELVENKEDLISTEQQWLDVLWDSEKLYNICRYAGSSLGRKHSLDSKKKIGEIKKNNTYRRGTKCSQESKDKIRKAKTGTILSEECKQKISKSLKGKAKTIEARKNMSLARKQIKDSTRLKISQSKLGEKNPNYGKTSSEETRLKRSVALKKSWAIRKAHLRIG